MHPGKVEKIPRQNFALQKYSIPWYFKQEGATPV